MWLLCPRLQVGHDLLVLQEGNEHKVDAERVESLHFVCEPLLIPGL